MRSVRYPALGARLPSLDGLIPIVPPVYRIRTLFDVDFPSVLEEEMDADLNGVSPSSGVAGFAAPSLGFRSELISNS
jgi:hypothetical protein